MLNTLTYIRHGELAMIIVEARVPAGGSTQVAIKAPTALLPNHVYAYAKAPGDDDVYAFVAPLRAGAAHPSVSSNPLLQGIYVTEAIAGGVELFTGVPRGGLPLTLFEPNGLDAQEYYPGVPEGSDVSFVLRSERADDVDVRITLTDEKAKPEAAPFPPLSPLWRKIPAPDKEPHRREYIMGSGSAPFAEGQVREILFTSSQTSGGAAVAFRPDRLIIPSTIATNFVILDFKVDGQTIFRTPLQPPQPALTFAEWSTAGRVDLGLCQKGSRPSIVVQCRGVGDPEAMSFSAALIGGVEGVLEDEVEDDITQDRDLATD